MDHALATRIWDAILRLAAPAVHQRYWAVVVDPATHASDGGLTPYGRYALAQADHEMRSVVASVWRQADPDVLALLLRSEDPAVREAALTGAALQARQERYWP